MMKHYLYILLLCAFLMSVPAAHAQIGTANTTSVSSGDDGIEGLSIFPNPVDTGKIYISTKLNLTKEIEIYNVLGKKIYSASLFGKELNISKLTPGIYILKIQENGNSATRKLVVR